jgi:uncharacterized Zn-binding protein involved in type VI secretion
MSRGIARLGDTTLGICKCHRRPLRVEGRIISASTDVLTNGRGTARLGDVVIAKCGHGGVINSASTKTLTNGRGTARQGDTFSGCYTGRILSASTDRFTM